VSLGERVRRRWLLATVPAQDRCSYCPQRAVMFESSGTFPVERIARCVDHPPRTLKGAGRCRVCGVSYWPDFLHLDCTPQEEP
jgi:hypothetical protein